MRATLQTEKANWLTPVRLQQPIVQQPVAIEPVQDETVPTVGALLRWAPAPNATRYLVQASRFANFSFKQVDVVTTDTFVIAGQLSPNLKYFWRIQAFNDWHTCASFTALSTFKTGPLVDTNEPDEEGWRCYPSLLSAGAPITLEIPEKWRGQDAQCIVVDATGRQIWQAQLNELNARMKLQVPSAQWPVGIYRLMLRSNLGAKWATLVLSGE